MLCAWYAWMKCSQASVFGYINEYPKTCHMCSGHPNVLIGINCLCLLCCSLLTILVLPSGPQYEVTLKGEVVPEDSGKPAIPSAAVIGPGVASDVPPILSNKQFVAWGGVTLGRAM